MATLSKAEDSTIAVIEDDAAVRDSVELLLQSVGYHTIGFNSADAFNATVIVKYPNCLIVDVRLPGLSGLGLQTQLANRGIKIPIIFVTGHGDIPMASQAMKAGAVNFLTKPFREQDLLDAIAEALERDRAQTAQEENVSILHSLFASLTDREREVANYVAAGLLNKQIAARIGLSEVTVKLHRCNAMAKLGTRCVADLVRMVDGLTVPPVQESATAHHYSI